MSDSENIVRDKNGFEIYGEKIETAPCQNQDNSKSNKLPQYDEDGLGLLPFDD